MISRRRALILVVSLGAAALAFVGLWVWGESRSGAVFLAEMTAARADMEAGRFASARARFSRLAERGPGAGEALYWLGRCEVQRGRLEAALEAWKRVPESSEWAGPAALDGAHAATLLGRFGDAEHLLRSGLKRPSRVAPQLRHQLLIVLGQQGRAEEARRLIEAQWDQPADGLVDAAADRLALLREHVGLDFEPFPLESNLKQLEAVPAPRADADRDALALARAHLATLSGDFPRAEAELNACLGRSSAGPAVWMAYLEWAVAAGRPDRARAAARHVGADALGAADVEDLRAWLARSAGDVPAERRALQQLIALDPARTTAFTRLAELRERAGDPQAARTLRAQKDRANAALDRYLQLYKQDRYSEHLSELAGLAEQLGRTFEARGFWSLVAASGPTDDNGKARADAQAALSRLKRAVNESRPLAARGSLASLLGIDRAQSASAPVRGPAAAPSAAPASGATSLSDATGAALVPRFEDDAERAGLAGFVQDNGTTSIHQLPEMSSGGVALLDYDGDGWLDVYCVQGGRFPPVASMAGDRLYCNRGDATFEDVTQPSGIAAMPRGYGNGVTVGDYDNDGRPDLFITRWRSYALYHNRGDGTFEDATERAGLGGGARDWPTSAAFADFDNDGDLDLYVCHYGVWDADHPQICRDPSGTVVATCDPRVIAATPDHLFRNDGGRFVDVTEETGIRDRDGRGLGVVASDLDGDGRIDLFVANDSTANYLFRNLGGLRFEEAAHESGVAANARGGYQAGMGVAHGDLDGDGRFDLAVTNYYNESTTLFHNLGGGLFADHTAAVGLAAPSRYRLGFGAAFFDADNDGWLDLITANGHVSDLRPMFPYPMTPQLYRGGPDGTLKDVTAHAGPAFRRLYVGRGLAIGDLDHDGRLDAVMVSQNQPLVFLHNQGGPSRPDRHFVDFQLEGTKSNRDGIGAVVVLHAEGRARVAERIGGGSFQSSSGPMIHYGLGPCVRIDSVEVRWPSGTVDHYHGLAVDRAHHLREGETPAGPSGVDRPGSNSDAGHDAPAPKLAPAAAPKLAPASEPSGPSILGCRVGPGRK